MKEHNFKRIFTDQKEYGTLPVVKEEGKPFRGYKVVLICNKGGKWRKTAFIRNNKSKRRRRQLVGGRR